MDRTRPASRAPPIRRVEWSETKNIRWKVEIPGRGSASPIVWGDRVFVLTAVPVGVTGAAQHAPRGGVRPRVAHRFVVHGDRSQDRQDVWERIAREEEPHEAAHPDNGTWASSSAITDGQRVYAYFESHGLYAYDMDGTLLWEKDLGDKTDAEPVRRGQHAGAVRQHARDRLGSLRGRRSSSRSTSATGKELWRVPRQEIDTWATPLVVERDGRAQVDRAGDERCSSYDLETGHVVWESDGLDDEPDSVAGVRDGMVFLMSGFQGNDLKAIRARRRARQHRRHQRRGLDAGSRYAVRAVAAALRRHPVFPENQLGHPVGLRRQERKPHYQLQRLDGVPEVFASPVGAPAASTSPGATGRRSSSATAPTYEVLAKNTLDDGFDASPALVDNEIYLRGYKKLYSIAAP